MPDQEDTTESVPTNVYTAELRRTLKHAKATAPVA